MAELDTDLEQDGGYVEDEITIEQRARAMGWKPKEEFRGDHRQWTDAPAFIEKGERELPILRDQNRRMSEKLVKFEGEVGALRSTVEEQTQAINNAMQMARNANDAGYKRALAELKQKQREAAASADVEAFDQIGEQIEAAQAERATVDKGFVTTPIPKLKEPEAPAVDPETTQFFDSNPWFHSKPVLRNAMIAAHNELITKEGVAKGAALADQYERARAEVAEAFPQFFPQEAQQMPNNDPPPPRPRPRLSPALNPTSERPRSRTSAFDRIDDPAEREAARAAYASIAKWDAGTTEEEYVTLYLNPKADPLELRAQRKKAH